MSTARSLVAFALSARVVSALLGLGMAFIVVPEAFGFYGRFQAIALVFSVFAFLRLERAVVVASTTTEAVRVTRLSLRILPFTTLGALAAVFAAAPDLGRQSSTAALVVALSLAFLGRGLTLLTTSWLLRTGHQAALSKLLLVQAIGQFGAQLALLALHTPTLLALILGEVAGAAIAVAFAGSGYGRLLALALRSAHRSGLVSRWQRLILFNLPATLAAQVFVALPLITVGRHSDPATTGHIALALRISEAPMSLITSAATSLAVTAGIWRGVTVRSRVVLSAAFVGAVLAFAGSLIAVAFIAKLFITDPRITAMLPHVPAAAVLTAGIALGGPHADLLAYAGAERRAFLVHALTLLAGLVIALSSADPTTTLLSFAATALCRSIALWLLLPTAIKPSQER